MAGVLSVSGCSWVAQTTSKATEAVGRALLSPAQEKQLGAELAAQVRQETPQSKDPVVQQYVDSVATKVLATVPEKKRQEFRFTFDVIDAPNDVNAFALPGGHIFVMSGLLEAVDSEAELAGVLSHEVAHVVAGHPSQQLAAQVGVQTLGAIALGGNPGLIQQLAASIVATGYLAAHTREMEEEADTLGVQFLASAGYDPRGMSSFFAELARLQKSSPNFVERFVSTHPAPAERSRRVSALIAEKRLAGGQQTLVGGLDQVQQRVQGVGGSGRQ